MEQKLVRVPFDIEMAKRIQNGEIEGRIVTRDNKYVRIVDFGLKNDDYPIIGVVRQGTKEYANLYNSEGLFCAKNECDLDLVLQIPEYLTFKDGDIIVCGWERDDESCYWISIVKSVNVSTNHITTSDYIIFIVKSNNHTDGLLKYDTFSNSGEWIRKATEEERQKLIDALKASKYNQKNDL